MTKWLSRTAFYITALVLCFQTETAFAGSTKQIHMRSGFLNGKYDGLFSGKFYLTGALDIDFEFFLENEASLYFRFIQGYDTPDSRPFYTYAGVGARHYFWGRGMASDQEGQGISVTSLPTFRTYVGADLGISQVIVKSFGPTVQAVANMFDVGANVGAVYQLSRHFGVEAHAGMAFGYGMSSTYATGYTERLFFGANYTF
jgi:hypothetical protein